MAELQGLGDSGRSLVQSELFKAGQLRRRPMSEDDVERFVHCMHCTNNIPAGESPQSYSRLDVGLTPTGLLVWCRRHNRTLFHVEFQDMVFQTAVVDAIERHGG